MATTDTIFTTGDEERGIPKGLPIEIGGEVDLTKFWKIVNGWCAGIEYFDKYSDGDTLVECSEDDPWGMPMANAHWLLRQIYAKEQVDDLCNEIAMGVSTLSDLEKVIPEEVFSLLEKEQNLPKGEPLKHCPFKDLRI